MSSRTYTKEELDAALASMGVTDQTDVSRYGSGHINDTFKVETKRGVRYILQRVNTDIFEPVVLKNNIVRVTEFLKSKGVKSLEVLGYENPWRLYAFLEGYTSRDVVEEPRQAYDVARAFAKFQNDCADIPAPRLDDIIPKFHDTPDRMRQLDEAVKKNYKGRLANVGPEMAFVESWRANASRIVDLMAKDDIPERVTHNDTKINNVLVAPDGTAVVIDLDTTMPGSALYDFGDMVRTSSAAAAEDEKDLSKVYSKKEYFEQLVRGYLEGAKFLNEAEKANLAFSGKLMTFEVGIRFLADYLNGDTYFHTAYEDHNLVRARTQFKMVQSMEDQAAEYEAIVKKYS
ncbi:MAG: aminoglycoside phosphotransferase family protein [Kiritimatiellae bacterium]|nr:aminoglycoside phosphotransferase family protein [Kiritimatiellia bacterium]